MKTWIASIAVCLLVQPAVALLDDGQDSLGCYFDDQGNSNCFDPTPGVPFSLYFILASPNYDWIGGYDFGWRFDPPMDPEPSILGLVLPPTSLNIGGPQDIMVSIGLGLVGSPATVLATCTVMTLGPVSLGQGVAVGPATSPTIPNHASYTPYENGAITNPMRYSTLPEGEASGWCVVATLDCAAQVVAVEAATWGAVKALYR
jgi:hypothetical protein